MLKYLSMYGLQNDFHNAKRYLLLFVEEHYPQYKLVESWAIKDQLAALNEVVQRNFPLFQEWVKIRQPFHDNAAEALYLSFVGDMTIEAYDKRRQANFELVKEYPAFGDFFVDLRTIGDDNMEIKQMHSKSYYISFKRNEEFIYLRKMKMLIPK